MLRIAPLTRPVRMILICLGAAGAGLWAAAIVTEGFRPRVGLVALEAAGAATCTILGAMLWMAMALRDRDKDLMVRSMADHLSQHGGRAPTGPLRLVEDRRSASA